MIKIIVKMDKDLFTRIFNKKGFLLTQKFTMLTLSKTALLIMKYLHHVLIFSYRL